MLEATGIEKDVDRLLAGQVGFPVKLATIGALLPPVGMTPNVETEK
jgi:hypothetical protein